MIDTCLTVIDTARCVFDTASIVIDTTRNEPEPVDFLRKVDAYSFTLLLLYNCTRVPRFLCKATTPSGGLPRLRGDGPWAATQWAARMLFTLPTRG